VGNLTVNKKVTFSTVMQPFGNHSIAQVFGYAPTNFETLAKDGILYLNNKANKPSIASMDDVNLLRLSSNACIIGAYLTNNNVHITPSNQIFTLGLRSAETATLSSTSTTQITAGVDSAALKGAGVYIGGATLNSSMNMGFGSTISAIEQIQHVSLGSLDEQLVILGNSSPNPNLTGDFIVRFTIFYK